MTQGAIEGVLEIDRLVALLKGLPVPTNGIQIQAQALSASTCSVTFEDPAGGDKALSLLIDNPMVTVFTPNVFFQEPVAAGVVQPGQRSQAVVPTLACAPAVDVNVADSDVNNQIRTLDETLQNQFLSATFMSDNVLTQPIDGPTHDAEPLSALLKLAASGEFQLTFAPTSLRLWHQLHQAPFVRNYPWPISQFNHAFLDGNRGLIPIRAKPSVTKVTLTFPSLGLPSASGPSGSLPLLGDILSGTSDWELDPLARGANAFLPTLPGVELDMTATPPRWQYRMAIPALDEAYAEAVEARDDADKPLELPPGFDPTRVRGAVAFNSADTVALGWMHSTDANVGGPLTLHLVGTPQLLGRSPSMQIELRNQDGSNPAPLTFSRTDNTSGATLSIKVKPASGANLPSFDVSLAGTAGTGEYLDHILRNGQPLLAVIDATTNSVRTHDGDGWMREQTEQPRQSARRVGAAAPIVCLTARANVTEDLCLDFAAVQMSPQGTPPTEGPRAQSWLLRNSKGAAPRLAGFPLRSLQLTGLADGANGLVATIEAILLPREDDDNVGPVGVETVILTFKQTTNAGTWTLDSVAGKLDWRFPIQTADVPSVRVLRVVAEFQGPVAGANPPAFNLNVTQVDLEGPTGVVTITPSRSATLQSEKLTVNDEAAPSPSPGFSAHLAGFIVVRDQITPPAPAATLLAWSLTDGTRSASLLFQNAIWTFSLQQAQTVLVSTIIQPLAARPATILFCSKDGNSLPPLAPGAWFQRVNADFALLGATFSTPETLVSLGGEVLLMLLAKDSILRFESAVAVELRITTVGEAALSIEASVTGELGLRNQIKLAQNQAEWTHEIYLTMDRALWPLEALFLGQGPTSPSALHCVVRHALSIGPVEIDWTVVQPVTLRSATDYAKTFIGTQITDPSLVVDAGWAFWLAERDNTAVPDSNVATILEHPALASVWQVVSATASVLDFRGQIAHVVRLPFANAGPSTTIGLPTIQIALAAGEVNRVLPVPGGPDAAIRSNDAAGRTRRGDHVRSPRAAGLLAEPDVPQIVVPERFRTLPVVPRRQRRYLESSSGVIRRLVVAGSDRRNPGAAHTYRRKPTYALRAGRHARSARQFHARYVPLRLDATSTNGERPRSRRRPASLHEAGRSEPTEARAARIKRKQCERRGD